MQGKCDYSSITRVAGEAASPSIVCPLTLHFTILQVGGQAGVWVRGKIRGRGRGRGKSRGRGRGRGRSLGKGKEQGKGQDKWHGL